MPIGPDVSDCRQHLRVLQLNSILWSGGTDNQCVYLTNGLHRLGEKVWMGGPDDRPFSKVCHDLGIPFCPITREGPLKLSFILAAARHIRHQRIQIVHGHHGRDYWRAVLAARWSGVRPKIVLHRYLARSPSTWISRRFLLNRTDAFIAGSHCVARVLTEGLYEPDSPEPERRARPPIRGDYTRVHVIHGGVDTEKFQPREAPALRQEWQLAPEHFVFAVVAGYSKPRGKGQREFLAAAAALRPSFAHARFLVIGRGDLADTLRQDIERLGLSGAAWLTPWYQDMPVVMNAVDCLVHPQIGTDAFPTVVLEAMACGKPVVATRVDGAVEQVVDGETGLLVPPEEVPALAEAMRKVLQDRGLCSRWGSAGRERVCHNFSIPILAQKVLALYRGLHPQPISSGVPE
jgi:glycosyltransferase involved in cell wall biosynthesis